MSYLDSTGFAKHIRYIKAYVNDRISHQATTGISARATADASGNVITTTYATKAHVNTVVSEAVADVIDSPTFTGIPLAPTPASGNNSVRIATTEFVQSALDDAAPVSITDSEIRGLWSVTVTIVQSSNQVITVSCNNELHTTTFTAQLGDTWIATIVADVGYNAGTLSTISGTLTENIEISATPATVKIYNGASIVAGDINFGDEETFGYIDPVNDDPHSSMTHSVDGCEIYRDDETSQPVIISAFNSETGDGITLSVGSEDAGWFQQFGGYVNVFQHGFGGTVEQHIVQNLTMSSTSVNHVDNRHINIVTQNQFEYGLRYGIVFSGDTLTDEQLVSWYQEHGL